jgi:hypothetical protein
MALFKRIAGRVGNQIELGVTFLNGGIPTDPYAIRMVRIYRKSVEDANLVAEIPISDPDSTEYPAPLEVDTSKACTGDGGAYKLTFDVPCDFPAPDLYIDVWYYIPSEACLTESGTEVDLDDESLWSSSCHKFWLYPDGWFVDDCLMVPDIGFEPLDVHFRSGEKRWLEVGLMPLPLYDFNFNQIMPLIPYLKASITIFTKGCETIVDNEPMEMGLRQGSYRTNPFNTKYFLDTSRFLKGTYMYRVTLELPDCQTIVSPDFSFTVS